MRAVPAPRRQAGGLARWFAALPRSSGKGSSSLSLGAALRFPCLRVPGAAALLGSAPAMRCLGGGKKSRGGSFEPLPHHLLRMPPLSSGKGFLEKGLNNTRQNALIPAEPRVSLAGPALLLGGLGREKLFLITRGAERAAFSCAGNRRAQPALSLLALGWLSRGFSVPCGHPALVLLVSHSPVVSTPGSPLDFCQQSG